MNKKDFKGTLKAKAKCGQNIFIETNVNKVIELATTNKASEDWYSGEKQYDFAKG